jgi:predicted RNA-binding Zn-ribbon protein involved in translation (DUF1610 family)
MIEAIRSLALSCGEDIVEDLRKLADELEAKKIKPAKAKKPKISKPSKVESGEFVMSKTKVNTKSEAVKWTGNQWNPPKDEVITDDMKTPNIPLTERDRPKNTRIEVSCTKCGSKRKVSSSLVTEFTKKYVCDKCIAGG